jgi:predicted ATPase with chaperone activity
MTEITATKTDVLRVLPHPPAPSTLEEAGLSLDLVLQLALKSLHFTGEMTGAELANRLGVRFSVVEPALQLVKAQHQVEIVGGGMLGGPAYRYRITDAGRTRAALFLQSSHYVGAAPVPLGQYHAYMAAYKEKAPRTATRERVRRAFSHLVIGDRVMDQLGPAINAGHSMFVYGPPGNGKTVISQAIQKLLDGDLHIPHALEVEGNIIRLFDPVTHEVLPTDSADAGVDNKSSDIDRRWVRCRRPLVMVGGELTLEQLELSFNSVSGFYKAPVQAVANGGVLVIDDFGRQRVAPRDLLNRWIVPLESRVDFLTLNSGQKFELPFMTLVAFATNIRPQELVDEAFLRRIHYKVLCESPSHDDYIAIFRNYCHGRNVSFDRGLVEDLLENYYKPRHISLRGCHPRDLIEQSLSLAEYLGNRPELTPELLRAACDSYFVDESTEEMSTLQPHA